MLICSRSTRPEVKHAASVEPFTADKQASYVSRHLKQQFLGTVASKTHQPRGKSQKRLSKFKTVLVTPLLLSL